MIHTIKVGAFQCNCYIIIYETNKAIIVDPGDNGKKINKFLVEHQLNPEAVLITHGHFDHVAAIDYLYNIYKCPIYMNNEDMILINDKKIADTMGVPYIKIMAKISNIPTELKFGSLEISFMHMPGHTPGSTIIIIPSMQTIFTGDVLFKGSIGRYDLPYSSISDTRKTIIKLKDLPKDFVILPGHDEKSTVEYELLHNPFLR